MALRNTLKVCHFDNNVGTATGIIPRQASFEDGDCFDLQFYAYTYRINYSHHVKGKLLEVNFVPDNDDDSSWYSKCGVGSVTCVNKTMYSMHTQWFSLGAQFNCSSVHAHHILCL